MKCRLFLFCLAFLVSISSYAASNRAVALLLDVSKSVAPKDFQKAKVAIRQFTNKTRPHDVSSIYIFGSKLEKIDLARLETIKATESFTMFYDSAYDVAQELARSGEDQKAILIFSDGYDTKSATTLEDVATYARQQGIAIHAVGIGKANRKVLQRIATLTGGTFFTVRDEHFIDQINSAISNQREIPKIEPAKEKPIQPATPSVRRPTVHSITPVPSVPVRSAIRPGWIAAILGAILLATVLMFVARRRKRQERKCPSCGRQLESYQTICPDCTAETKIIRMPEAQTSGEGTQEIPAEEDKKESIPHQWMERSELTQEILSRTFVLIETPLLVVKSGKHLGESYSLSRDLPVSIGRSRVNEIHLDDVSISAQHCRIVPENEQYVLHDLGSTNGTFVNNRKLSTAVLKQGDVIKVGETEFVYKVEQTRTSG